MNLKSVADKVTSKMGRQVLITQKHSPVILFGVGVAGVVTTVVLASRATLKMDDILTEAKENQLKIQEAEELETEKYTEQDATKDHALNRTKTALKIVKAYAPAFAIGVISIGCLTGSHIILTRRNVGLTAAYAALDRGFKDYRKRVVGELGGDKDREFLYGTVEREVTVDTDEGPKTKTVTGLDLENKSKSPYSYLFARETSRSWSPDPGYNLMFLSAQERFANAHLNAKGFILLNDVLEGLGMERTSAGCVVGWVKGSEGDGYVDFGVFEGDSFMGRQFVEGKERNCWLDFNVDGVVYDKI